MPRLFFGLEFPVDVKQALEHQATRLQQDGVEALNWSDPSLYHITVLFLGDVPTARRPELIYAANSAVKGVPTFTLELSRVGSFERNRILWVGLHPGKGMEPLNLLYKQLYSEVARTNVVELETRPYRPHITLARKLNVTTWQSRSGKQLDPCTDLRVEHLCLFESTRQDGVLVYPVLERFALRG